MADRVYKSGARHGGSGYTQDERNAIAAMLRDNRSAAQIGKAMGRTRNAIIGLVGRDPDLKRIGLRGNKNKPPVPGGGRRRSAVRRKRPSFGVPGPAAVRTAPKLPAVPPTPPESLNIPLTEIGAHQCRFAVNDAAPGETHLFCGAASDGSWCVYHRRIVYLPMEKRS